MSTEWAWEMVVTVLWCIQDHINSICISSFSFFHFLLCPPVSWTLLICFCHVHSWTGSRSHLHLVPCVTFSGQILWRTLGMRKMQSTSHTILYEVVLISIGKCLYFWWLQDNIKSAANTWWKWKEGGFQFGHLWISYQLQHSYTISLLWCEILVLKVTELTAVTWVKKQNHKH